MSDVQWCALSAALDCRACGFSGTGEHILSFSVGMDVGARADGVRCPECRSIQLVDEPRESTPDDWSVDDYIELTAGLGSIAELLDQAILPTDRRLLDVGCGYGLSLDYATWRHRVKGVGVEPSWSAQRGSTELGLDIHRELLTEYTEVGDGYDVVFSSEVLEHVTDPVEFLTQLRRRLAPGGRIVITTPNADVISPQSPPPDVDSALSAGFHVFLASPRGLAILLERAGFAESSISTHGIGLRAVARPEKGALPVLTDSGADQATLLRYYRNRLRRVPKGSALEVGMAARALRTAVALGDLSTARRLRRSVLHAIRARYGVDPSHHEELLRHIDSQTSPPHALGNVCFGVGMLELLTGRHREAVQWFDSAIAAVSRRGELLQLLDLDSADALLQSVYHRLLALAVQEPVLAAQGVQTLRAEAQLRASHRPLIGARMTGRVFTTLVSQGSLEAARTLAGTVSGEARELATSDDREEAVTGRDALYSLGTLAVQSGDASTARSHLLACIAMCDAAGPDDDHAAALRHACEAAMPALPVPAMTEPEPPVAGPTWMIDTYWCDASGTFVQGWMHLAGSPADELRVATTGAHTIADRRERVDLRSFWPGAARVHESGFRVYVPGPPGPQLDFVFLIGADRVHLKVDVPDGPRPILPPTSAQDSQLAIDAIANAPAGPVLVLGSRSGGIIADVRLIELIGDREILGLDIHEGNRVDIIGDVHDLASLVPPGRYPVVVSLALLEHVEAPWVVAREIARVLPVGGVTVHQAPWLWPSHAEPHDFWRFSSMGLARLFGPELGFEVIGSGMSGTAFVHPAPEWRADGLEMPTTGSGSMSWVAAVKVDDRAERVEWPYDRAFGRERAEQYPIDGIMPAAQS